ncbi:MAG: hypothetical protein VR70_02365 [Rhodospirillaceae bacterium BRH_c57]|nr:MAG: hypothetical protein VR70_02365 [Rhodospirillaceae bacterium BRH_c57]
MSGALADFAGILAVFLLANILAGLVRVVRGPAPVDRMLAAQLLTTMGIAATLVFGMATGAEGLLDVALVLAVLAALVAVTFARRFHGTADDDSPEEDGDD